MIPRKTQAPSPTIRQVELRRRNETYNETLYMALATTLIAKTGSSAVTHQPFCIIVYYRNS